MESAHDRGFAVAGAMTADLLADLAAAVERATAGESLESFRARFREIVETHGWHGWTGEDTAAGRAWRTRVIYRTNVRTSFMAGRFAQLQAAGYKYWVYRHGGSQHPREEHLAWDGLILPAAHPFWLTHFPPNGWGCSCRVQGARSIAGAIRLGGDPSVQLAQDWDLINQKTGAPGGIDKGWAYAPGRTVADEINALIKEKAAGLPAPLAKALEDAPPPPPIFLYEAVANPVQNVAAMEKFVRGHEIADRADLKGLSAKTVGKSLRYMLEVHERFDLAPLAGLGPATRFGANQVRGANAAIFPGARNAETGNRGLFHMPTNFGSDKRYEDQAKIGSAHQAHFTAKRAKLLARPGVSDEIRRRADKMDKEGALWNWTLNATDAPDLARRKIIYHEYGHVVHMVNPRHPEMSTEINRFLQSRPISKGWSLLLSDYASDQPAEYVAEAFSLYMTGPSSSYYRIHPDLLTIFQKWDKKHG